MKRTPLLTTLLGLTALMIASPAMLAQRCSMAAGAGAWGFTITGQLVTPTGLVPVVAVGRLELHADGTLAGTETRSVGGGIADETITGTFSVNADCTAKYTFDVFQGTQLVRSTKADGVIVNQEQETMAIFTSVVLQPSGASVPPILTVSAKRISRGGGEQ